MTLSIFMMVTLEQKIGQLLIVGFLGTGVEDPGVKEVTNLISLSMVGGVVHFRRNIASDAQIKALNTHLQSANPSDIPLLVAIDQEGTPVVRTANIEDVSEYPSAKAFEGLSLKAQQHASKTLARRLAERGFNFNFAPCVDLDLGSPVISGYDRSYSNDPERVVECATVVCKAHHDAGVIPCLKHYPGHGSAQGDTHEDMIDVTKTHLPEETKIFHMLVTKNVADAIMTAHLYHAQWDDDYPATMSPRVLSDLRAHGFKGVIISDDMHMGAIIKKFQTKSYEYNAPNYDAYDYVRAAILALQAGCDILIYSCNTSAAKGVENFIENLNFIPELVRGIASAVRAGEISESIIDDKYRRVMKLRNK